MKKKSPELYALFICLILFMISFLITIIISEKQEFDIIIHHTNYNGFVIAHLSTRDH